MTLYELTGQYQELLDMAEAEDVDPQVIADTMEAVGGEIEDKAEGYACIIKQLEADAIALKTEEERMAVRRKSIENNAKRMKEALQNAMVATDKRKFKTQRFSFNVQKNAPSVTWLDEELIPEMFRIPQPPKYDKAAAKEYLMAVGGSQPWGELTQSESLRIR